MRNVEFCIKRAEGQDDINVSLFKVLFDDAYDDISLYFNTYCFEEFSIWIKNLKVNGILITGLDSAKFTDSQSESRDAFYNIPYYYLNDIEYFDINKLQFNIMIEDWAGNTLYTSPTIKITCDTICETYSISSVKGTIQLPNINYPDTKDDSYLDSYSSLDSMAEHMLDLALVCSSEEVALCYDILWNTPATKFSLDEKLRVLKSLYDKALISKKKLTKCVSALREKQNEKLSMDIDRIKKLNSDGILSDEEMLKYIKRISSKSID